MKNLQDTIREIAAQSLARGEVELVIGWEKGDLWWQSYPAFIEEEKEADRLIWDPLCVPNLSRYLLQELSEMDEKKIALFVKGCDALAFNQLLQDNRTVRERVVLYGIPCDGLVDPSKLEREGLDRDLQEVERDGEELVLKAAAGEEKRVPAKDYLYDKCLTCRYPNPVAYDQMLGETVPVEPEERFTGVRKLEELDYEDRFSYWAEQFSRCIRCFACRNVCPACSCIKCVFDLQEPRWLGKATEPSENAFYHIIRAYHVAGRCVDCGECSRVCPVDIPLQELNRKIILDINELYGEYDAGVDPEQEAPLITYKTDDPAAFTES